MKKSIEGFRKVATNHKIVEPFLFGKYSDPGKEMPPYYEYTVGGMLNDIKTNYNVVTDVSKLICSPRCFFVPNLVRLPLKTPKVSVLNPKGEKVILNFDTPKITLLYFYANTPEINQATRVLERMILSHPEWKGGIKVLAFSIDDGFDFFEEYLARHRETPFEHYFLRMGVWNEIYKAHGLEDYPLAILLNEEQIIEAIGHPLLINLESKIMSLICKEPVIVPQKEEYSFDRVATYKAYSALNSQMHSKYFFKEIQVFHPSYSGWEFCNIATGQFFIIDPILESDISWPEVGTPVVNDFKSSLHAIFKDAISIFWNDTIYPNVLSKFADNCDKCKAKLGEVDQWRCVECYPPYTLCPECAKFKKYPPTSYEDTGHCHLLFRITSHSGPMLNAPVKHFKTLPDKVTTSNDHCDWSCWICRRRIKTYIRWKCAVCRDYDVCESCFNILSNPEDPKFKEMNDKAIKYDHLHDVHIYVRSPFYKGIPWY